ncbi:hypothetical protein BC008_41025 [Mastigocoleus testarum BC008]|uniref:Uncharacterized protein n=1 Tax=Mastigocoleus testarum BC008 TaxID=371196 RepID=A0A0V7ZHB2_9CYAN|nr:hypothetical protein BC008_40050 [Mastigocoleus testarum BC008]KST64704.1 hypothetical protein BC008_41025 [Mastigocoleus testarum BC008]
MKSNAKATIINYFLFWRPIYYCVAKKNGLHVLSGVDAAYTNNSLRTKKNQKYFAVLLFYLDKI